MSDFLRQVRQDVKDRKNLELYATLILAFGVILADIIGVDTQTVVLEIVMAVLALLAFGLLQDRHASERVERKVDDLIAASPAGRFFAEWDDASFRERLTTAREVSVLAIAVHVFLSRNTTPIEDFLRRGGTFRCMLVEPRGKAMEEAAQLAVGYEQVVENIARQAELSLDELRDFARSTPTGDEVNVKLIDHLPYAIMTMVDHQYPTGVMYVTLNGYQMPPSGRPSFTLHKDKDEKWFRFFQESFENLWNSEGARIYQLQGHWK